MDLSLFLTNLNYLSILLMIIFALTMLSLLIHLIAYVLRHRSCPRLDQFHPERFRGQLSPFDVLVIVLIADFHLYSDTDSISTVSESYGAWLRKPVATSVPTVHCLSHGPPPPDLLRYGMSKSMDVVLKDPDNDSLFTVSSTSDVYQDRGLGVDLNEKFYMKSVRPASK